MSAFYGWLDCVKRLVETVGLNPKGENGKKKFHVPYIVRLSPQ